MTCLYEATVDDIIQEFMQIINYRLWLKGSSTRKGLDQASLKLKAATHIGDPKFLAKAMRSYPKDLNRRNCALEGYELLDQPKTKLATMVKV